MYYKVHNIQKSKLMLDRMRSKLKPFGKVTTGHATSSSTTTTTTTKSSKRKRRKKEEEVEKNEISNRIDTK